MTLSPSVRRADAQRVLVEMFNAVGDMHRQYGVSFGSDEEPLLSALPTTVSALKAKGYIAIRAMGGIYELTRDGWLKVAMELLAEEQVELFERRRIELIKAMKRLVKDRDRDVFATPSELAQAANLPDGWVWHALKTGWFELKDESGRFGFTEDFSSKMIRIPAHFGQNLDELI